MANEFSFFKEDFPAIDWFEITPEDDTDLARIPRNIWVGGAGDLTIVSETGNEVTFSSVPAGTLMPVQPQQVSATDTTATEIIGLI